MAEQLEDVYRQFERTPFPRLAKSLTVFPLYDASIAGLGSKASQGIAVGGDEIPDVDEETDRVVRELRQRPSPSQDEIEFLAYFDLLQRLVGAIRARSDEAVP